MTLDNFLNVAVPAAIFIFLGVVIYNKAKKPIDNFARTVKGWFKKDEDGGDEGGGSSNYQIEYRGMEY